MKLFVAIDVGCHECGVDSEPIGAAWSEAEALAMCEALEASRENRQWRDGGQSIPQVFAIDVPEEPSRA